MFCVFSAVVSVWSLSVFQYLPLHSLPLYYTTGQCGLCMVTLYFSTFPYTHHLCTMPLVSVVSVWSLSVFQYLPLHSPPLYYATGQCGLCMVTLCISVPSLTLTTSVLCHWSVWSLYGHSLYFSTFPYTHHLCTMPLVSVVSVWSLSVFQCLPLHSPPLYYATGQCGLCMVTLCISVPSLTFTTSILYHWSVWSLYGHSVFQYLPLHSLPLYYTTGQCGHCMVTLYFSTFPYIHYLCTIPLVSVVSVWSLCISVPSLTFTTSVLYHWSVWSLYGHSVFQYLPVHSLPVYYTTGQCGLCMVTLYFSTFPYIHYLCTIPLVSVVSVWSLSVFQYLPLHSPPLYYATGQCGLCMVTLCISVPSLTLTTSVLYHWSVWSLYGHSVFQYFPLHSPPLYYATGQCGLCMVTLCISVPSLTLTTSVLCHWSVWSLYGHSLYFSTFPYIHYLYTIPLVSVVTVWSLCISVPSRTFTTCVLYHWSVWSLYGHSVFQYLPLHSLPLYYTTGQCGHCMVTLYFSTFPYIHYLCTIPLVSVVTLCISVPSSTLTAAVLRRGPVRSRPTRWQVTLSRSLLAIHAL